MLTLAIWLGPDTTIYPKYETENVLYYRYTFSFEYPEMGGPGKIPSAKHTGDLPLSGGEEMLKIDAPASLDELILRVKLSSAHSVLEGYRVQIFSGGDLESANTIRGNFIELYPDQQGYRIWVQPTFRVRVGNFQSRNDAINFANQIKKDFPGAFVVPDQIEKPKSKKAKPLEYEMPEETPPGDGN